MAINVEALERIKQHVLEEPLRLNMRPLLARREKPERFYGSSKLPVDHTRKWPACGTVGCISGWEIMLYGDPDTDFTGESRDRLGLPNEHLFYVQCWPVEFYGRLGKERPGTLGYAKVVAEAIDDYIATGGW